MAYNYIVSTGTIVPDTSDTLSLVQTMYKSSLGQDLNLDPNTPQGQLITADTIALNSVIRNNTQLANQLNPNNATGVFLRSIGALMNITDTPTRRSVCVNCIITGIPNSIFPSGSVATNQQGAPFLSIQDIVLDANGSGTVTFQARDAGPIEVPVNTLSPSDAVIGWSKVVNPTSAAVGSSAMTDYEYRLYRQNALSNQSQNCVEATESKLVQLPGVTSVVVRENDQNTQQTVDGVVMPANSLWVCVNDDGGVSSDILNTLLTTKAPGCAWTQSLNNAGTPFQGTVVSPSTGQTYVIKAVRSIPTQFFTRIYVNNANSMVDLQTAATDAILNWAAGSVESDPGLVVGRAVSPFDISGSVTLQLPGTRVRLCQVSLDGITWSTDNLPISLWQRPTLPRGNIQVIVE